MKSYSLFRLDTLARINQLIRTNRIYATKPRVSADHTNNDQQSKACAASETDMFQNRINYFVPNLGSPAINTALLAAASNNRLSNSTPMAVQVADIYQAAKNRAVEDHELDKLFNPDFYDYQI
jgi:hypothetical protein